MTNTDTTTDTPSSSQPRSRSTSIARPRSLDLEGVVWTSQLEVELDQLDEQHEAEISLLELDLDPAAKPYSGNPTRANQRSRGNSRRMSRSSTSLQPDGPNLPPTWNALESASHLDIFKDLPPQREAELPTTYSSLPPSPRGEDYGVGRRGLDIDELQDVFKRLDSSPRIAKRFSLGLTEQDPGGDPEDRGSLGVDEPEDEFWPALSRRQTLDSKAEPPRLADLGVHPTLSPPMESPPLPEEEVEHVSSEPVNPSSDDDYKGISLWDLLKDEDAADQWEGWIADGKWERIANFLAVPLAVEKVTLFGALLCLDGFLYNFTILPIRATFAGWRVVSRLARGEPVGPLPPSHVQSLVRINLLVIPAVVLLLLTDGSKMYHSVRGQDTIKLYVIFNALEIADRLCCAFGQDVLDTLFSRDTLTYSREDGGRRRKREHVRPVFFFFLSLGYVLVHTLVFLYMLISLNVAINSYDYTLISLLISNQFVEIKGSVFKKFEKENLFQIMCSDIVERFQLGLMLVVIAIRNMIEMAGSDLSFLPKSFIRGKSLVERILSPVLLVLASEMVVDWLKHAFIAKFNHIRSTVYGRFIDVLAKDVLRAGTIGSGRGRYQKRKHPILLDQSPLVARRLGIASVALAVLVICVGGQAVGMLISHAPEEAPVIESEWPEWVWTALKWGAGVLVAIISWGCLVTLKILLGLGLLSYSALRQTGMDEREAEDAVNNFGRRAVGISKEEIAYEKETTRYLSQPVDDLPDYPSAAKAMAKNVDGAYLAGLDERTPRTSALGLEGKETTKSNSGPQKEGKGKKSFKLEEVERWTMIKRIW